jgi:hypothetical protein
VSYCRKCGAKLQEDAKFCHVCGTPVSGPVAAVPEKRKPRARFPVAAIILIAILATAIVVGTIILLPLQPVNFTQSKEAPSEIGVEVLNLDFGADVSQVNLIFRNLANKLVVLNVSATGSIGIFASTRPLDVTFDYTVIGDILTVTSRVNRVVTSWPWFYGLNVVCNLYIDPSVRLNISARTSVGNIVMTNATVVVFNSLSLETTTGTVDANLSRNVILRGNVLAKTITGSVEFDWDNANAENNALINVETTTGSVNLNVRQSKNLDANVTLKAAAVTGGINFIIRIENDVGAKIESSTTTGGIDVVKVGFTGTKSPLESSNYPAQNNFLVNLRTTTGGININATYAP